jgi:SAM-dependent methyltransferase
MSEKQKAAENNPENESETTERTKRIERAFGAFCGLRGRVLDVGCGGDREISYADRRSREYNYVGVDPFTPSNAETFTFVKGVAERLPFKDRSFDVVLFATSLDHVTDINAALLETRRVLRPGGMLCVWQGLYGDFVGRRLCLARRAVGRLMDGTLLSSLARRLDKPQPGGFVHPHNFNTPAEVVAVLSHNGFRVVDMRSPWAGDYCFIKAERRERKCP